MATISSAGIGSGLDVNGLVSKLMAVESQPLEVLNTKEASYQAKLSAYGSLKGALASVQSSALSLKSTTLFKAMSATSGNTSVVSASANTAASAGTYAVKVIQRAQPHVIASQAFLLDATTLTTSDISTIDGKLKIELGTFSGGTFTTDPDKTPVTIDIDATASTLPEIRDAINAANAGVKANLVYVGAAGYKLTVTSTDTGEKNSIKLTTMDANDVVLTNNTDLAKLSFDPEAVAGSGNEFTFDPVSGIAQDASFTIDGIGMTRTTNSFSDAITGVTLTLGDVLNTSTTLTVAKDGTSAKSAITSFVKNFNDLNTALRGMIAYNVDTGQKSVLTGDSGARSLQNALRDLINYRPKDSTGTARSLSDLGVALQRDGSLVFTATKFDTALAASSSDVSTLFSSTSAASPGIAVRMYSTLEGILSSTGLVASHTEGLNSSITDLKSRRSTLERRLTQIEARYRKQFNSLDSLVASMQKTSQYLTQQLASLPSTTK